MFDTPFRYGSGWDKKADAGPEPVVVLSEEMNDKLFGGKNSVGKTVRISDRDFRVVGVLERWEPNVKFYDLTQNPIEKPENIYMPFNFLKPMQLRTFGNTDGWGSSGGLAGFDGFLQARGVLDPDVGRAARRRVGREVQGLPRPLTSWTRRSTAGSSGRSTTGSRPCTSG